MSVSGDGGEELWRRAIHVRGCTEEPVWLPKNSKLQRTACTKPAKLFYCYLLELPTATISMINDSYMVELRAALLANIL